MLAKVLSQHSVYTRITKINPILRAKLPFVKYCNNINNNKRNYGTQKGSEFDSISLIRNIGMVAHVDAGKTTTTERMLFYSGFIKRVGEVDLGNTVMDYLPAERERGITINSAAITFGWRNHQFNLIDTPGHIDFTIEVERSIRVLDGCVTILDAVSGVQAQTINVWKQAKKYNIPKLIFINKLDREGASIKRNLVEIKSKLNATPLELQIPVFSFDLKGKEKEIAGFVKQNCGVDLNINSNISKVLPLFLIDVVSMEIICFDIQKGIFNNSFRFSLNSTSKDDPTSEILWKMAIKARSELVESLGSMDDAFLETLLSEEINGDPELVPHPEIKAAIRRQTISCNASPVLFGASYRNFGIQPVLDSIIEYLPSPLDTSLPIGSVNPSSAFVKKKNLLKTQSRKNENEPKNESPLVPDGFTSKIPLDPNAPVVAFAFKVVIDPQRGTMIYVKVYSGTLNAKSTLINSTNNGAREKVNKLLQMYADYPEEVNSFKCGDIGVIIGCKNTRTGDTLLGTDHKSLLNINIKPNKNPQSSKNSPDIFQTKDFLGDNAGAEFSVDSKKHEAVGMYLHGINIPPPVFFCSIEPESPSDEKYLKECLASMMLEDPSLIASISPESGQLLLSGMGELHLEIVTNRLINELKAKAFVGKMRVSYRETIGLPTTVNHAFEKTIQGKNYKFHIGLTVEPIQFSEDGDFDKSDFNEDEVYELDNKNYLAFDNSLDFEESSAQIKTQAKSRQKSTTSDQTGTNIDEIKRIIHGAISTSIYQGPILGFSLTGVKIKVNSFAHFGDDLSSPAAIKMASKSAIKEAFKTAEPLLLEPVMKVTVNVQPEHVGYVMSELERGRRATILSLGEGESDFGNSNHDTNSDTNQTNNLVGTFKNNTFGQLNKDIISRVPLSSMIGFSSVLRKLTAGSGSFTMAVDGFNAVDEKSKGKIIKEFRGY
ncbi:hypothetical protein BB560_003649 [Smittium megazygosporum]|uniref:Elongation factor 2 n=1 Tax=Smittium megazygosporum TaxID=133381 RepID=A0A2T9ZBG1_9FUNG|nr:hypothetical protein BB560_003649 [Smittium megazygosporum]